MTTPQDSPRRNRQKRRRTKQLAEWRARQGEQKTETKAPAKAAKK